MINRASHEWRTIAAEAEKIMVKARQRLEEPSLPPLDTEHLRGKIAAMKQLLALADEQPAIPVPTRDGAY